MTGVRGQEQREAQMGRESWKFAFQHSKLLNWLRACCETVTSHKVTSQLSSTQKKRILQVPLHKKEQYLYIIEQLSCH